MTPDTWRICIIKIKDTWFLRNSIGWAPVAHTNFKLAPKSHLKFRKNVTLNLERWTLIVWKNMQAPTDGFGSDKLLQRNFTQRKTPRKMSTALQSEKLFEKFKKQTSSTT